MQIRMRITRAKIFTIQSCHCSIARGGPSSESPL